MRLIEAMNQWAPGMFIRCSSVSQPGGFVHFKVGTRYGQTGAYKLLTNPSDQTIKAICLEFICRDDFELVPEIKPPAWRKLAELPFAPKTLHAILNTLEWCVYLGSRTQCVSAEQAGVDCWIEQYSKIRGKSQTIKDVSWFLDAVSSPNFRYYVKYVAIGVRVAGNKNVEIYERINP